MSSIIIKPAVKTVIIQKPKVTKATIYRGPAGAGLPAGGTAGQVPVKASSADYDTEWQTVSGSVTEEEKATWNSKQDALVSGTNIKTVNSQSLLGSGNITISGGGAVDSVNGQTGVVVLAIPDELADLAQDATHRVVTDAEKSTWSGKQDALGFTAVPTTRTVAGHALSADVSISKSDVGLGNVDNTSDANKQISTATSTALAAKADLVNGLVPASQLPSYVDDVLEYANMSAFPATGESGKIYIAQDTNITYRWTGTGYAEISASLALGETAATAYRGDRGAVAYTHSQASGNPHGLTKADLSLGNVDNTSDANKPVSTPQQTALNLKADSSSLSTVATSGSYADLSNKPTIPTALADLTSDSTHRTVTDAEKATWNAGGSGVVNFSTAYEAFDHFIGGVQAMAAGLGTGTSGSGSVAGAPTDGLDGVVQLSTGSTASATQGGRLSSMASSVISMGSTNAKRTVWRLARNSATWFDATLTGFLNIGFIDGTSTDSTDGVYFRIKDGSSVEAVCRSNSTETAVSTGISISQNTWNTFDIQVNSGGTEAKFYIDGTLVATITTNLPSGSGRQTGYGLTIVRTSATGTTVSILADWMYLKITPTAALW